MFIYSSARLASRIHAYEVSSISYNPFSWKQCCWRRYEKATGLWQIGVSICNSYMFKNQPLLLIIAAYIYNIFHISALPIRLERQTSGIGEDSAVKSALTVVRDIAVSCTLG